MTRQEVAERVIKVVVACGSKVEAADIMLFHSFKDDLGFDSLDSIDMKMRLGDEFDMTIPDEEAGKMKTVGAVVDWIAKKLGATD